MSVIDHHLFREDRAAMWQRIAEHISSHPEHLSIALENIDRWESLGRVHRAPLNQWRERILAARVSASAMQDLLDFMRAPNHDSEPLKSCSPFVGLPDPAAARS